jgi:hypothetical protein
MEEFIHKQELQKRGNLYVASTKNWLFVNLTQLITFNQMLWYILKQKHETIIYILKFNILSIMKNTLAVLICLFALRAFATDFHVSFLNDYKTLVYGKVYWSSRSVLELEILDTIALDGAEDLKKGFPTMTINIR